MGLLLLPVPAAQRPSPRLTPGTGILAPSPPTPLHAGGPHRLLDHVGGLPTRGRAAVRRTTHRTVFSVRPQGGRIPSPDPITHPVLSRPATCASSRSGGPAVGAVAVTSSRSPFPHPIGVPRRPAHSHVTSPLHPIRRVAASDRAARAGLSRAAADLADRVNVGRPWRHPVGVGWRGVGRPGPETTSRPACSPSSRMRFPVLHRSTVDRAIRLTGRSSSAESSEGSGRHPARRPCPGPRTVRCRP